MDTLGEKLRVLRKENKMTIPFIANELGIKSRNYQFYETNERKPPYPVIKKLCLLFNVSADYLIGLEPPSERS